MEHLIANSGLQFCSTELNLNLSEPLVFDNGRTLKYSFLEMKDFLTEELTFDIAYFHSDSQSYIPLNELKNAQELEVALSGREILDLAGMPKMKRTASPSLFSLFPMGSQEIININSLDSYKIKDDITHDSYPAYQSLLNKWIPMPMFEKDIDGITCIGPYGWCRVKIEDLGQTAKKGERKYRFIWAFDTKLTDDVFSTLRPNFVDDTIAKKEFCLCNKVDELLSFMSTSNDFCAFSDYVRSLFGVREGDTSHKYIGYYIYLINYIRLVGAAPDVVLYNGESPERCIDVDLVLDIGNSRTCGILFENGDFSKRAPLSIRDLSNPWKSYDNSFDMRMVFRKTDFGNDIVLKDENNDELFNWSSLVRVGNEAKNLVYTSREDIGESEKTTNYSSPKRYLWDQKAFNGKWEFLTTIDDPSTVRLSGNIYVQGLSDMFDSTGRYYPQGTVPPADDILNPIKYSRSALMTFVLIEIFQHAICQMNSQQFRNIHHNIDCKRVLRNIILTCPTAMPIDEQIRLRECAENAYDAISRLIPFIRKATVIPSSVSLTVADDDDGLVKRQWSFDEASCCQLVYLYAEMAQRYSGEVHRFFELKGHVRPEDLEDGYEGKSLTIASIDIGAGTTDVMINSYRYDGKGRSLITPRPIFWDSYYLAGDEILRKVIQNQVLEGVSSKNAESSDSGSIANVLKHRLLRMTDSELQGLPCLSHPIQGCVYRTKVSNIINSITKDERNKKILSFAIDLVHDYFGKNNDDMTAKDQRCRVDFNTQISLPMAQLYLELLRLHRPTRSYSFDELFPDTKPASYLLDHFAQHFGFRFEEINWRFDPIAVSEDVKSTMEPMMKTLSEVVYAHRCDILIIAGRPSSLDAITELFIKYIPLSPSRLVRLNEYRVGEWYPFSDGQGQFSDQKTIVAVGAMIGYLASHDGFNGMGAGSAHKQEMVMNFTEMIKQMKSTALYIGDYKIHNQQLREVILTPHNSTMRLHIPSFPLYLGCSQFNSKSYQARPLYAIYSNTNVVPINVTLSRSFQENRERLIIEDVSDSQGTELSNTAVELVQQSIVDGNEYWLDNGQFELTIMNTLV